MKSISKKFQPRPLGFSTDSYLHKTSKQTVQKTTKKTNKKKPDVHKITSVSPPIFQSLYSCPRIPKLSKKAPPPSDTKKFTIPKVAKPQNPPPKNKSTHSLQPPKPLSPPKFVENITRWGIGQDFQTPTKAKTNMRLTHPPTPPYNGRLEDINFF